CAARLALRAPGVLGVGRAGGGAERVRAFRHAPPAVHNPGVRRVLAGLSSRRGEALPGGFRADGTGLRGGLWTAAGPPCSALRILPEPGRKHAHLGPHSHELAGPPTDVVYPV